MRQKKLTSLYHPLIQHWIHLRKERTYREEKKEILLLGKKVIQELSIPIKTLLCLEKPTMVADEVFFVTEPLLKKITGLDAPDGVAAVVDLPLPQDLSKKNFLLILDQVSDPGNLGTLVRSALALGWEAVVATPGTVDFFNDKVIRASRGALFHLPYAYLSSEEILSWKKRRDAALFVADRKGSSLETVNVSPPLGLILSSEGKGAQSWAKKEAKTVSIPMHGQVESLNVSQAGAILLYEMRKSR